MEDDENNTIELNEKSSSKNLSSVKSRTTKKIMKLHKSMSRSFENKIERKDCENIVEKFSNLNSYVFEYCLVTNTNLVVH